MMLSGGQHEFRIKIEWKVHLCETQSRGQRRLAVFETLGGVRDVEYLVCIIWSTRSRCEWT